MSNADSVTIHPHGSPELRSRALVELISGNGRSIALRLQEVPVWAHFRDHGMFVHVHHAQIVMLLTRETVGPWVEVVGGGHFEIEPEEPTQ